MLGKLMKYEWRATRRTFLPLYIAMVLIAIINGIFFKFDEPTIYDTLEHGTVMGGLLENIVGIVQTFAIILYVGIIIGTVLLTLFVVVQRYYKNILGTEGYLMHTLPVKSWELILSKGVMSAIWTVCSGFVAFLSIIIMIFILEPEDMVEAFQIIFQTKTWEIINEYVGVGNLIGYGIELLLEVLCASWLFCMKAYAAMSLGHLVQKHRLLGSIGFYIGIDLAENVIMGTLVAIFGSIFINPIQQFFSTMTTEEMIRTFHGIFLVIIIFYLVLGSIYFIVSKILLEKKLNLE